jgi:outer membrane protein TolC
MMLNRSRLLVCASLCVASQLATPSLLAAQAPGENPPIVTLAEARRRAAGIDPQAVAARGDLETASWERRAAMLSLLVPSVTATTSYVRLSDPFFNFGTGQITRSSTNATLQASYSLLGTRKLSEVKRSRAVLEHAAAAETAAQFRVALATDLAYYAVLADGELARVAADRLRRAEEQFGVARVRVLAGEAISSDSLRLLLEVNRARFGVLQRDSALTVARLRLGRQIGLEGPAGAAPIDSTLPPPLPLTLEQAVAEARRSGPELQAARAAELGAGAALNAERMSYVPEITLGAITGAYDAEFFPSALKRSQAAITVSMPVWNGGQREVAVARARAQRDLAVAERRQSERAAREAVAEAYHGYETARAGSELAAVGLAVATEDYRVQRARYQEGATTIVDLMEAQVALSEAQATLVQARYATRLALARLEALLGRRILDDSNPPS